ncbi:PLP-dependent cysteine synthase family protein [Haliangium ochraceum]|uniref:Pyridoxal-5'-phosphate-dependent protein beta subunit n=1 Tax=Haliangium ochraceum (strain DSM 14365 / JCM 11303 / SMP-2) TaxID=502025 RepID=D0LLF5_HALO1|nr:pyridoxal-phosphate dependent enzyme [Haliangium ochraceum]ACY18651.1 Pyridoxal-5'-phosphate-dependent protein beta subunit [Haliangium ochraceum DSM 14365]
MTKKPPFSLPSGAQWPRETGTLLDLVGNTPLYRLQRTLPSARPGIELWAKLEGYNPGGSIKARPAAMMLHYAITTGQLRPGQIILDSTSGNTGIAFGKLGAALGYAVKLTMSSGVSIEKQQFLRACGVDLVLTDAAQGSDGAIRKAQEIYESDPDLYFMPNQYHNPANVWSHYLSTGPELWAQSKQRITHLVAAIGTGGTVMGTGWWFREYAPHVRIIAVEPDQADHGLNGMRHIPSTMRPGIYHESGFDRLMRISTDTAYEMAQRVVRREGLLLGASAAAVLVAAQRVIQELSSGVVVALCADRGERYLSTRLFESDDNRF